VFKPVRGHVIMVSIFPPWPMSIPYTMMANARSKAATRAVKSLSGYRITNDWAGNSAHMRRPTNISKPKAIAASPIPPKESFGTMPTTTVSAGSF